MTAGGIEADPRIVWQCCDDEAQWVRRSVEVIVAAVHAALASAATARLLLSGGSTPLPVYRALADAALDWSRLVVGLVDDRDVEPDDVGSNARLVRESMLGNRAIVFRPLRAAGQVLAAAVDSANADPAINPAGAVLVLGMGDDGHTASLFPAAHDLDVVLATAQSYARFDAGGCAGAGNYPQRITLTPAGIARSAARVLLLRGAGKRAVFERALAHADVRELPIRLAIESIGEPLQVVWCRT